MGAINPVLSFGWFALAAWLLAGRVSATQFLPLSVEELGVRADLIVHGIVQSKTCARDERGCIVTKIGVVVSELWKGAASTNLVIVQSGGILGEEGATVAGQASYEIGEEVVAFLVLNPRGEPVTVGLAHGKFHVWKDPQTGEKLVRGIAHQGAALAGPGLNGSEGPPRTFAELKRRALKGR